MQGSCVLSLTSHAISQVARPYLFRELTVYLDREPQAEVKSISALIDFCATSPHLACLIRNLKIFKSPFGNYKTSYVLRIGHLHRALSGLPTLKRLSIEVYCSSVYYDSITPVEHRLSVEHLSVDLPYNSLQGHKICTALLLQRLFFGFREIRTLHIRSVPIMPCACCGGRMVNDWQSTSIGFDSSFSTGYLRNLFELHAIQFPSIHELKTSLQGGSLPIVILLHGLSAALSLPRPFASDLTSVGLVCRSSDDLAPWGNLFQQCGARLRHVEITTRFNTGQCAS